jgi:uroporphyrinogen decarboxylase
LPYEKRIFDVVHGLGAIARLHICGDTTHILADMTKSGAHIIDLDWMVNMQDAEEKFGDRISFCGNFDPVAVMLNGTVEQVYSATIDCMIVGGSRSFSAAGCEIADGTPHENMLAQAKALKDFGSGLGLGFR